MLISKLHHFTKMETLLRPLKLINEGSTYTILQICTNLRTITCLLMKKHLYRVIMKCKELQKLFFNSNDLKHVEFVHLQVCTFCKYLLHSWEIKM